jgi:hypothetical protein
MEGGRHVEGRHLSRRYESNRLEDQVLALAYEEVWPLVRKAWSCSCSSPQHELPAAVPNAGPELARSA